MAMVMAIGIGNVEHGMGTRAVQVGERQGCSGLTATALLSPSCAAGCAAPLAASAAVVALLGAGGVGMKKVGFAGAPPVVEDGACSTRLAGQA